MRSRYSAYCTEDYQYILDTYGSLQRKELSTQDLESSAKGTQWTALSVCSASIDNNIGYVEFRAYYRIGASFFVLHEASKFIKESNRWFYTTGDIQPGSGKLDVQRNAPCPCLSQLKYKRCCGK
jgi:SEC-C motif-containing protein